ncbi:MAG: PAS domain S-box protein [Myxococcales bacterium]
MPVAQEVPHVPAFAQHREEVLARWASEIAAAARRRGRSPALLGSLASIFDALVDGTVTVDLPLADPRDLVAELSLLRVALRDLSPDVADAAADRLLEEASAQIAARAASGSHARERILTAPAARLLDALLEESRTIDCAAILDANLVVREAAGLERGFLGSVAPAGALDEEAARTRTGLWVRDSATDPRLERSPLADAGIRALHALPLVDQGVALGLLHAGSRTAYELPPFDVSLLRAAAARAAEVIAAESSRAEAHRLLALQDELARALSLSDTIGEAMKGALSALCDHLGFDVGLAWLVDDEGKRLQCRATHVAPSLGHDLKLLCEGLSLGRDEGLPGKAWARGEPVFARGFEHETNADRREQLEKAGLSTAYAVPMRARGETLGVLEIVSRGATAPTLRPAIETVGRQAGQFLRRHRMQEQLHAGEALRAAILASSLDAFVAVDKELRIREWTASAERVFGYPAAEAAGRDLADLILQPELREPERILLLQRLEAAGTVLGRRLEMTARHRDGGELPVEISVTRIDDQELWSVAVHDISERRRAERAARNLAQGFEQLIEAAPLPIISLDMQGRVRIWNRAAEQLTGYSRAEVVGRDDLTHPDDESRQQQIDIHAKARSTGSIVFADVHRKRRDGSDMELSLSVAPLRDPFGAIAGTISIAADITERKKSQAEALRTARFREQFVGIVGHDLRNPLSAIVTAAQLLLQHGGLSERHSRAVARILASGDRMTRMIDDLLDFTRSRLGGGFPISRRRVDLVELCEQVIEELELAHPERSVEFRREGDAWGSWDPDRMAQVVSNLIGNALQHSPEHAMVRVELRDRGERVELETYNEGPAIPADVLPHIFEPGRRGPSGRGRGSSSGLGLGLYIVRQIVLAHEGSISVRSSPGDGTRFLVVLPRRARAIPA